MPLLLVFFQIQTFEELISNFLSCFCFEFKSDSGRTFGLSRDDVFPCKTLFSPHLSLAPWISDITVFNSPFISPEFFIEIQVGTTEATEMRDMNYRAKLIIYCTSLSSHNKMFRQFLHDQLDTQKTLARTLVRCETYATVLEKNQEASIDIPL